MEIRVPFLFPGIPSLVASRRPAKDLWMWCHCQLPKWHTPIHVLKCRRHQIFIEFHPIPFLPRSIIIHSTVNASHLQSSNIEHSPLTEVQLTRRSSNNIQSNPKLELQLCKTNAPLFLAIFTHDTLIFTLLAIWDWHGWDSFTLSHTANNHWDTEYFNGT